MIIPAILSEISGLITADMKNKQRTGVLKEKLPGFSEMFSSFMRAKEDEENVIFLVAQSCAQHEEQLAPCFAYLIIQLMYGELRIITAQAILDWLESARNKMQREKAKKQEEEVSEETKKEGEENKVQDNDSYYDEEEGEDAMQISDELM